MDGFFRMSYFREKAGEFAKASPVVRGTMPGSRKPGAQQVGGLSHSCRMPLMARTSGQYTRIAEPHGFAKFAFGAVAMLSGKRQAPLGPVPRGCVLLPVWVVPGMNGMRIG